MFKWAVVIFGAPGTLFECGYFKLRNVCISILHLPGDETLGEHPSEQWNPTRNATTVLLSLILLLDAPNTSSPANVEASLMYRKWKDSSGRDDEYARKVRSLVANTQIDAAQDQVRVPRTTEEY
ncbi:ubiquitin-conjugating enzyme E2 R2 isoform X2-like, partial [Tropilaelaps mercedesae]